jgi:hypothetical protein
MAIMRIRDEQAVLEAVTRVGPFRWLGAIEQHSEHRRLQAIELIRAYEANVTTGRLRMLLADRGPGAVIPTEPLATRPESRSCAECGRQIAPGQAYVVDGPFHIRCGTTCGTTGERV